MNLFTKSIFAGVLPCAAVSAQGLYSIAPNAAEAIESLPLTYVVGASVGFDDNPTPLFGGGGNSGSIFADVFAQANFTSVSPQTTWDVFARIGARFYFDDFEDADSSDPNLRIGVNLTHRFNERLRFSSRNFVAYEAEPDFETSIVNDRRVGDFFRYSSQNSVGYRWSERLGTQTGVDFQGVVFDDIDGSDFNNVSFRHDFRYRVSPQTVVTAGYRFGFTSLDGSGSNSTRNNIVGGIEHQINQTSSIVLRGGVQISSPDGGSSQTRPFFEGAFRSQLTEQLNIDVFARYSNEGFARSVTDGNGITSVFDQSQTVRVGGRLNYALNPRVSVFGGINYIFTDYEDLDDDASGIGAVDGNEQLVNLNAGFNYKLNESLSLTGSYNYTTSTSDFTGRSFDRNRVQLGVQATF